ncbi:hypothetical protein [Streptomyces sp. NPDC091259]|uniref:hypothetical protein n=1 Tax=Streptomyces sp. NPDC091259 TaxID=3365976 RepID=UPI0037FD5640
MNGASQFARHGAGIGFDTVLNQGVRFAATWGSRDVLDVRLVRPDLVAEITADRTVDRGGVWRHPLRFRRLRLDVAVGDVPRFGEGSAAAAG